MEAKAISEFAERFEAIKHHFRLKNRDLARIAQVSDNAISKLLNGATDAPDVKTLVNLAKNLNLSGAWLLLGEGDMLHQNHEDSEAEGKIKLRDTYIAQLLEQVGKPEGVLEADSIDQFDWSLNYLDQNGATIGTPQPYSGFIG